MKSEHKFKKILKKSNQVEKKQVCLEMDNMPINCNKGQDSNPKYVCEECIVKIKSGVDKTGLTDIYL